MKILYGVQGTGNGHISRAMAMHAAFQAFPELEITWLLSSRPREQGLGTLSAFEWRKGLSFVARNGSIDVLATLRQADLRQFRQDINTLDLHGYDLVISDYEPVICHAARKRGIPVTGIGHQYAFMHQVPRRGDNVVVNTLMRRYAPASLPVGLHWHHFDQPILPPIVDLDHTVNPMQVQPDKIIAYLPFENADAVCALLRQFPAYQFYVYHPAVPHADTHNLHLRPISRTGFKQDLLDATGVITNAGFELISECLQWQKKIIAKPLRGQMEQLSNAAALQQLGYAAVTDRLDATAIEHWLKTPHHMQQIRYPDVARALAGWIAGGQQETVPALASRLWQQSSLGAAPLDAQPATA
ncbi:MAG TPA: MJ1255/VC2487 family glycosyltransferase [Hyphomicrobiales bacterium]|nr:MJ1255/VC2487 family glycosyltransferase [Hyphomicrobiales bacterium]